MLKRGLLVAALVAAAPAAQAKTHKQCLAEIMKEDFDLKTAKRICKPGRTVKPPKLGWQCEFDMKTDNWRIFKAPGGARRKSDVFCDD